MAQQKGVFSYLKKLVAMLLVGSLLGGFSGLITLLLIKVLEGVQHLIWTSIPSLLGFNSQHSLFTITACSIGGLLVGLGVLYLGNYPVGIIETITDVKTGKSFDYQHIPQTIINSIISLGFGAALGPEAALTSIVGGFCAWISHQLKFLQSDVNALSLSAVLGSIFSAPVGSATVVLDKTKNIATKLQLFIASLVAAFAGFEVYRLGASGESYFHLNILPYTFHAKDLLYAIVPAIFGCLLGLGFLLVSRFLPKIVEHLKHPVLKATVGGTIFGALATVVPLMLFSGHEGVQALMTSYATAAAGLLLLMAIGKSLAANLLLTTGWKGGQFFPVMFAGAALGLASSQFSPTIPAMVGLVAGMTATLATVLKKPLVAGLFVVFFFPPKLYGIIVVATLVVMIFLRLQKPNNKRHHHNGHKLVANS